jgi:type IV pilus assembly protein PilA
MSNKKGFTLIELLAIIVILAIIALITTPIVLNLINQSKEAANKRSVEAYAKAVEYAVMQYEYNNNGELPTDDPNTATNPKTAYEKISSFIEYSNSDVHCLVQINGNGKGSVDICGCQVGSYTKTHYKYSSVGGKGADKDTTNTAARTTSTSSTACKSYSN